MSLGFYEKLEKGDIVDGLEILGYSHSDSGNNRWLDVRCFCGKEFKASAWRIKKRHTKSCGCLIKKICSLRNVNTTYKDRCNQAKKGWESRKIKNEIQEYFSSKFEAVEWWKKLKSKNGFLVLSKKDKQILEKIILRTISNL